MSGPESTPRRAVLGGNQYGKAETRVVRITREGATHHLKDLNVSVALSGDLDDVHHHGDNAHVLPTDTMKNTVFAFAKEHGIASAEEFALLLAEHFVRGRRPVHRARVRVEEYAWGRIPLPPAAGAAGEEPRHSFVREGPGTRTVQVTHDGERSEVLSGVKGLTVLNSTDSEFTGFARDAYTTLEEDRDRILATEVTAVWRHGWEGGPERPDWDVSWQQVCDHMLRAFAGTYSLSLQQTLHRMGARVVEHCPEVEEIRFSMPNKHHFRVDLTPFGLTNEAADGAVYFAADRPYGLIEGTVLREGAGERIPADLTNL
jgi:urate oxidase